MTSAVTLHWHDYLEKFAKTYLGAGFISVCSQILIKGLCAKRKSLSEQHLFFHELTVCLAMDIILQAQLKVRLIM